MGQDVEGDLFKCCTNVSKLSHKYYKMSLNCHINDTKGTGKGTDLLNFYLILKFKF